MLKAIVWHNTMHILGPNSAVVIEPERIIIRAAQEARFLSFREIPKLQERIKSDLVFANLVPALVGQAFIQFLNTDKQAVLDLAGSLIAAKIDPTIQEVKGTDDTPKAT